MKTAADRLKSWFRALTTRSHLAIWTLPERNAPNLPSPRSPGRTLFINGKTIKVR